MAPRGRLADKSCRRCRAHAVCCLKGSRSWLISSWTNRNCGSLTRRRADLGGHHAAGRNRALRLRLLFWVSLLGPEASCSGSVSSTGLSCEVSAITAAVSFPPSLHHSPHLRSDSEATQAFEQTSMSALPAILATGPTFREISKTASTTSISTSLL
jgi:hypothetical protein